MADGTADQRADDARPLLAFVHIPKTAGTTLTTLLSANEPGSRMRHGGNVFKGGGGIKHGVKYEHLLDDEGGGLDAVRILAGHFPLGIRNYMPNDRDVRFFTFLRQPADRTLSHYFQIREKRGGDQGPNKLDLPPLPAEATVEDALERGYIHDNVQTRMLSGLAEPFGEVDEEMLERAQHNLREELVFFGLTERFDESLVLAKRRLGLRSILYSSPGDSTGRPGSRSGGRVNTSRPRGEDVPKEVLEAAAACNRFDIELYRYAQELFEAAPERQQLDFEVEVAALRAAQPEGEIDLTVPPPAAFEGGEQAWRMLLESSAKSFRTEQELAAANRRLANRGVRQHEVVEELLRIHARGKSLPGRDADTALRAIEILDPTRARRLSRLNRDPKPRTRKKARDEQAPMSGDGRSDPSAVEQPGRRGRSVAQRSASDASEGGRARKPREGGRRRRRRDTRPNAERD